MFVKLFGHFKRGFAGFAGLDEDSEGHVAARAFIAGGAGEAEDHAALEIDVVGAEALLGQQAVRHRVAEGIDMAGSLPDGRMHDDGRIDADDVFTFAGHGVPPGGAQVALELRTQRAVVPEAADAAVDFAALIDEAAALAEGDDFLHERELGFGVGGGHGCEWAFEGALRSVRVVFWQGKGGG